MNKKEVIALLESHKNEKGIQKWNDKRSKSNPLQSYGIGLTVLRKLAKRIGRNHELALELWDSNCYDVKVISMLIDDPKKMSIDQIESQVEEVNYGYLAHVFSSCDAALAKTSFVNDLILDWVHHPDETRRRCGYGLLYEASKSKKKSAPDNAFFLDRIKHIQDTYKQEGRLVLLSMGGALLGIGKRNATLNAKALDVAKEIGPIHFAKEGEKCDPFDVVKHLTSDYIKKKLGLE